VKKIVTVVLAAALASIGVGCDVIGDIDPVGAICTLCEMVDEAGLCEMVQTKSVECKEGEVVVLVGLDEVLKEIEAGNKDNIDLQSRVECRAR
jgi:hypothetical protein